MVTKELCCNLNSSSSDFNFIFHINENENIYIRNDGIRVKSDEKLSLSIDKLEIAVVILNSC